MQFSLLVLLLKRWNCGANTLIHSVHYVIMSWNDERHKNGTKIENERKKMNLKTNISTPLECVFTSPNSQRYRSQHQSRLHFVEKPSYKLSVYWMPHCHINILFAVFQHIIALHIGDDVFRTTFQFWNQFSPTLIPTVDPCVFTKWLLYSVFRWTVFGGDKDFVEHFMQFNVLKFSC